VCCESRKERRRGSNDRAHVEPKNWAVLGTVVGYHRHDTPSELLLLNKIWILQSWVTNYFLPPAACCSKSSSRRSAAALPKHEAGYSWSVFGTQLDVS